MATLSTTIIAPSGGDYVNYAGWEPGEQADIVSADEIANGQAQGTWTSGGGGDASVWTFAGWTTDATRYALINTDSANAHVGLFDDESFRFDYSGGVSISDGHIHFDQIQFNSVTTSQTNSGGTVTNSWVLKNRGSLSTNNSAAVTTNIVGLGLVSGSFYAVTGTMHSRHVTQVASIPVGFDKNSSATHNVYNCIAQNASSQGFWSTLTGSNNLSNTAAAPGANPITSATVTFVGSGDYHIDPGDTSGALASGLTGYATTDLAGDTFANPPNRGAFASAASGDPAVAVSRRSLLGVGF
jgi:hypothetical protein